MKPPLIGITLDTGRHGRYALKFEYAAAVEKAGGLAIALPYRTDLSLVPHIVEMLDGILFTGGDDLDPALYGEKWHPQAAPVDPDRQRFELSLLAEAERRRTPTLGICLGAQLMNLHRGGSLFQFLPDLPRENAIEHRKLGDNECRHPVHLNKNSILARSLGTTELIANTGHKQSIRQPGRGLCVIATAPDGVIEGIEDPSMPLFLGVQWHPERLHDEPHHLALFQLLVDKAGQQAGR